MERKNANIDDVIRTVETASAKELEELAGIREAVEDLKGGRVATVDPVSRSVSALNRTIENSRPDFVANAPSVDPIVEAMKRLNLGDVSRVVQEDVALQEPQAKSTTRKGKKRRKKAITEDVKAQRTEAAEHAREMFGQKGGAQKSQNQRDARGRFIGKSGSKAAAEEARAERAEKARRKDDDERLNAESGLLKKLSKVAEGIGNPSETRAVDALGYAVAGPLWAAGKELGGISKEVGGSLNGARKSIADVIRGNDDNSRRKGFFRRKSQSSADVVQVNTQKRTVQELQDQTSEIKEGNDKILSALDQIAKNTGKKKGGLLSKLFSLLGKGAGGIASLIFGRGALKKVGSMALGALGIKGVGKLGIKAVAKGALRAIPLVGTVAGGIYDAVTGWNDIEAQRRAFVLKDGEEPSFQQKAAYTLANVLDMGGLVSGISSAIGEVLKSLGFEDIGNMLQSFSTESIAQAIDSGVTNLETYISNLGDTISTKFDDYTTKIGDAISAWFSDTTKNLNEKLDAIKNFFTVDNLKQVFSDAIDSAIDFIKNPGKYIKEAGSNLWHTVKEHAGEAMDKTADAVIQSTPLGLVASTLVNKANAKEVTPELKTPAKESQERNTPKSEDIPKKANIVTRVVNASLDTAQNGNKTVKETANQIINANAVETGNKAAQTIDAALGQSATGKEEALSAYEIDKRRFNNGKDVSLPKLNAAGYQWISDNADYFDELERKYGLEKGILSAVASAESSAGQRTGNPVDKNGNKLSSALGAFQITKGTREDLGLSDADAMDTRKAADGAARYLSMLMNRYNGDQGRAIAAYHAGMGHVDKGRVVAGTGEYVTRVRGYQQMLNNGAVYGSKVDHSAPAIYEKIPDNAVIDQSTGLAFTPGDSPFEKGGLVDKIGNAVGVNDLVDKFMNGRGMRREVVQGTLEERARGRGTATAAGNVYVDTPMPVEEARPVANNSSYFDQLGAQMGIDGLYDKLINARGMRSNNSPQPASTSQMTTAANDLQQPTGRMQIDGQVISDLGGSGAKPTMQLADNTVSLDGETKRLFAQMTSLLARIEEHTKDSAKGQGTVVKVSTPQPGVMRTVPLSIDDPLMNDYARVD
ncbi:TPA: lytic transglycosylase domain-containing protein [Escherichia coli]|nr:lytic transglycosylase domain-containing protein [Escherichia coli]EIH5091792.1 lytic transglycosylase domain-containing protein [Escherichia coli]EIH8948575.1 lytic transglycosylase domain-containing protein [Escherichia coli]HCB8431319.1 lytic transglycosylase domain-containing protein [Escherichia coli]HCB8462474.1 lytic transglycosylase domain-containing protein [Escherichia coli]